MAKQLKISKLLELCLLILVALQISGWETSVLAESNLKDVYADRVEMEDGDFIEMDYFEERFDIDDVVRHSSRHRPLKFRKKHKHTQVNYDAYKSYQPSKSHNTPLGVKHTALQTQSIVSVPKYEARHRPPSRYQPTFPAALRAPGSTRPSPSPLDYAHQVSNPLLLHPHDVYLSTSYHTASHPARSDLATSYYPVQLPTASLLPVSFPAPSRHIPHQTASSTPTTSRPAPSRATPSYQASLLPELSLIPLTHPVLFGPDGFRPQTARPKTTRSEAHSSLSLHPSQEPTSGSLPSASRSRIWRTPTSHKQIKRLTTTRPSTFPPSDSYATTFTTRAPSTLAYSTPALTSSATTSSSTYSSTPTSSLATFSTHTSDPSKSTTSIYIPTSSTSPKAKKSQSKKKSTIPRLYKPEHGPLKLKKEIPIKPVYNPKSTFRSSASVANKEDCGFFFSPTNGFPDFFKQLLQG